MARAWKRLTPSGKINEQFQRLNDNAQYGEELEAKVEGIESTIADQAAELANHELRIADAEAELVEQSNRIDNIINEPAEGKDLELVDIRTPDSSYTPLDPITTAGGMTRDMQKQFVEHKADFVQLEEDYDVHIIQKSTESNLGHVKVDGNTISSASDGTIRAKAAAMAYKRAEEVTAVNTTDELSLMTLSIPGGTLGSDGGFAFGLGGRLYNETGSDKTVTVRIKFGSTTLAEIALTLANASASRGLVISGTVLNGTAASQRMMATIDVTAGGSDKLLLTEKSYATRGNATSAEDTATDKEFRITIQMSAASSTLSVSRDSAFLKFIARG